MKPLAYVIVINWNGIDHLPSCLGSLARLSYGNARVVLVDNGSTDGSRDYVRTHFPEVTVLENRTNVGFAAGNNRGMAYAMEQGAEFIALLNNDMEVDPDWITALVDAAGEDASVGACAPKLLYFRNRDIVQGIGVCLNRIGLTWDYLNGRYDTPELAAAPEVIAACGGAFFVRAAALRDAGLFDPAYFIYLEDVDLSLRIRARGYRIITAPAARAYHKASATMRENSPRKNYLTLRNRIMLIVKCFPAPMIPGALAGTLRWECGVTRDNYWRGDSRMIATQARALLASVLRLPRLIAGRRRLGPAAPERVWGLLDRGVSPARVRLPSPPAAGWDRPAETEIALGSPGARLGPGWYLMYDAGDRDCRRFAREASVALKMPPGRGVSLRITVGNDHAALKRIGLRVRANGRELGRVVPGAGWNIHTLPLGDAGPGPLIVTLRADGLYSADATGEPTDLSFKVRSVGLEATPA
jgi:GT2 family glycosyltransferase